MHFYISSGIDDNELCLVLGLLSQPLPPLPLLTCAPLFFPAPPTNDGGDDPLEESAES